MLLTPEFRTDYEELYATCQCLGQQRQDAIHFASKVASNRSKYEAVSGVVPWWVTGIIHGMEAGFNFNVHLHNGDDPLTHQTTHEPRGLPAWETYHTAGPFTWQQSAHDALSHDGLTGWTDWSVAGTLFMFEKYNGFGYRSHGIHSPYLWGGSNHQQRGKYDSDGHWNPNETTQQIGAAVILHTMEFLKMIPALKR